MSEEQTLSFQAEVSRLLHIVAHSLYSEKEIFLRELISNASDACDKLRYEAITRPELTGDDADFRVVLSADKAARTLEIADNGIGMGRDDMVDNLGTIARSGTLAFMEQAAANKKEGEAGAALIGQFGVGFYSAFMVADRVTVISRKAGEEQAWRWASDGKGDFTVGPYAANGDGPVPARGTRVILHLAEGEDEYLEPHRIRHIVRKYSDHIGIPIVLRGEAETEDDTPSEPTEETLNTARALWTRPKSEITEEQYKEFYHHVAHAGDDPWLTLHFRAEGMLEYSVLLFVPSARPYDLFHPDRKNRAKLYVRRVFVTDDCPELLPAYLRFLRGVVDSEDLPLNVSRELLQNNPMLTKMRSAIVKRAVEALAKRAEEDPEGYAEFWRTFGPVVKEGLYEDLDQRDSLMKLVRFRSTKTTGETELASVSDYVGRMRDGQTAIYYVTGEDEDALRASPHLEGFLARDVEVLLLTDPVDDFWLTMVPEIDGKPLKSATRAGTDLADIAKPDADAAEDKDDAAGEDKSDDDNVDGVIALMKLQLQDRVKDVRRSDRLTGSPVCLVADEGDMDMHLERLLRQNKQIDNAAKRVLEINPNHKLIRDLAAAVKRDGTKGLANDVAELLLDQALVVEGEPLPDPAGFARRLTNLVEKGLSIG